MSVTPSQKFVFHFVALSTLTFCLSLLFGCSGSDTASNALKPASGSQVVVDVEQTIPRIDPTVLNDLPRSNPFEAMIAIENPAKNRPASESVATAPSAASSSALPANTLEGITLSGVIYSPHSGHSMAILQVAGDEATQILQQGQSYTPSDSDGIRIQVEHITRDSAKLTAYDQTGQALGSKTCKVEDIIGFKSSRSGSKSASSSSSNTAAVTSATTAASASTTTPAATTAASTPSK